MNTWTKNCTKKYTRIDGGRLRTCGREFTTVVFRRDWCDQCVEASIKLSLEIKAAADRYREEQRAAGRAKVAGQWTYDTTDEGGHR
jgi:hypothetical protein